MVVEHSFVPGSLLIMCVNEIYHGYIVNYEDAFVLLLSLCSLTHLRPQLKTNIG